MRVLVIGNGGREHAICWKLKQSPTVSALFCAPGNPGIATVAEIVPVKVDAVQELIHFASQQKIDLTIVGPEYPLSLGIVDQFRAHGLKIFGPTKGAARLESSKSFAKEVMQSSGVPTASYAVFRDIASARVHLEKRHGPVVLKADGLAGGKGVVVCQSTTEALSALPTLFSQYHNQEVVIEDFLEGQEVSFIVATDGTHIVPLALSHDYKRVKDGDQGPNTGGMGSVCPTPRLSSSCIDDLANRVVRPVLSEMAARDIPFSGFLYAGLMISPSGEPFVLEFNTRLGDPETQSILRLMKSDLFELLFALSGGGRMPPAPTWEAGTAVTVVLASRGYPEHPEPGDEIMGLNHAAIIPHTTIFHAGTTDDGHGNLATAGGRVLNVTALGETAEQARGYAYRAADMIQFRGRQLRRDIALS